MNNFSGFRKGLVCVSAAPSHILVFVRAQIYAVYSLFSTVTSFFSAVHCPTWSSQRRNLEDLLEARGYTGCVLDPDQASNALFCW